MHIWATRRQGWCRSGGLAWNGLLPFGEYMASSGLLRLSSPRFSNCGYFLRAHPPFVFYFTATSIPFSYCLTRASIKNVYGQNRSSWSAVQVDAGKHVDFCRGFVLSTAEKVKLLFTSDKAYGRAAVSWGGVGKRWKTTECFCDTRILRA